MRFTKVSIQILLHLEGSVYVWKSFISPLKGRTHLEKFAVLVYRWEDVFINRILWKFEVPTTIQTLWNWPFFASIFTPKLPKRAVVKCVTCQGNSWRHASSLPPAIKGPEMASRDASVTCCLGRCMTFAAKQSSVAGSKAGKGRHIRPLLSAMAGRILTKFSQGVPIVSSYLSVPKTQVWVGDGLYSLSLYSAIAKGFVLSKQVNDSIESVPSMGTDFFIRLIH